jgi:cytochrome P450
MKTTAQDAASAPPAPDVPLGLIPRLNALRVFHTGFGVIRDAGGPVAMVRFGPGRLLPRYCVVTSPQGIRDVLGGTDDTFDKFDLTHVESLAWGDNLLNMPHEAWLTRRRALQPLFTKKHVADYSSEICATAESITASWADGSTVDLDHEARVLTLRVLGRSIFGLDLGDRAEELAAPMNHCLRWVSARATRPVRSPIWLPTPARARMRTSRARVQQVIDEAISAARNDPDHPAELINLLFKTIDPVTGRPLTDRAISDELFVFIIAGHDTSSTTIAYSLWALGRNPVMQNKVAAEVAAIGDRTLTVDDVARLPYTVQVVHEALRQCPPASAVVRFTTRDAVADGYRIPAGTNILVGIHALHHDPAWWPDPADFDPDRFTSERSSGRDRWSYLPFGGGPRACIGQHFAMLEAVLGVASMVRSVEIVSANPDFPLAIPFTTTAAGPIPARVRRRQAPKGQAAG